MPLQALNNADYCMTCPMTADPFHKFMEATE